jgi:hypothetical protein
MAADRLCLRRDFSEAGKGHDLVAVDDTYAFTDPDWRHMLSHVGEWSFFHNGVKYDSVDKALHTLFIDVKPSPFKDQKHIYADYNENMAIIRSSAIFAMYIQNDAARELLLQTGNARLVWGARKTHLHSLLQLEAVRNYFQDPTAQESKDWIAALHAFESEHYPDHPPGTLVHVASDAAVAVVAEPSLPAVASAAATAAVAVVAEPSLPAGGDQSMSELQDAGEIDFDYIDSMLNDGIPPVDETSALNPGTGGANPGQSDDQDPCVLGPDIFGVVAFENDADSWASHDPHSGSSDNSRELLDANLGGNVPQLFDRGNPRYDKESRLQMQRIEFLVYHNYRVGPSNIRVFR